MVLVAGAVLFFFTIQHMHGVVGKKYEDGYQDVLAMGSKLKWNPKINNVFSNKNISDIKRFMGVSAEKKLAAEKAGGRNKAYVRHPDQKQLGRNNLPQDNSNMWKNTSKYKTNYWNQDATVTSRRKRDTLPTSFDWRDYSNCQSLFDIRYQQCGDCWAVSSSSVMSDRYCLWTFKNKFFSARQVTTCVYPSKGGCDGGWPRDAMYYYEYMGVASGGDPTVLTERAGCLPYPSYLDSTSKCPQKCTSGTSLDKTQAGDYYEITTTNVTEIMEEIYNYGPVVAIMEVFEDFPYLGTGIYQYATGTSLGLHAVRIIGYGQDFGVKYWIVANSWGSDWADNGYCKILRGANECGIENWITAVSPAEAYSFSGK